MDFLKKLQDRYKAGKLTKEQYEAKVKEYLEDELIEKADHDKALTYDPTKADPSEEKLYTEDDMQHMAHSVARRVLRKEFKTAGIDLDVDNKGLIAHVVGLVKDGGGKAGEGVDAKELERLKKVDVKVKALEVANQGLTLENVVLRSSGTYKPVNALQVVRALRDYQDDIEYDENGVPDKRSLDIVMKRLAKAEPNLFEAARKENEEEEEEDPKPDPTKLGKPPGGGNGGGGGTKSKEDAKVADALLRMGLKAPTTP